MNNRVKRFWASAKPNGDCMEWQLARNTNGYGVFSFDGKQQLAHRVSWQIQRGPIPDGAMVLHRCDNPPCVRIEHLFIGDASANVRDAIAKGRWKAPKPRQEFCLRGHSLAEHSRYSNGRRVACKLCDAITKRIRRARKPSYRPRQPFYGLVSEC